MECARPPPRLLSQDSFCSARCTHHRAPRLLIHFKQTYCPFLKHLRLRLARSLPQIIDSTTVLGGETKQSKGGTAAPAGEGRFFVWVGIEFRKPLKGVFSSPAVEREGV
jgi:hypothetical protein